MPSKITINWLLNDIWYYLFIVCFDWKIRVFQQTAVMVYYILKEECSWNFFKIHCKSTCAGIFFFFFFLSGFSFTDTDNSQDSRGRQGTILFHSTTSTRSRTFRHLFATLHVRWLSHIFNRNACIYQTATEIYHLIELLFDWLMT